MPALLMSLPMQRSKRLIVTIGQSNRRVGSSSCSAQVLLCAALSSRLAARDRREPRRRRLNDVLPADPRRVAAARVRDERPLLDLLARIDTP